MSDELLANNNQASRCPQCGQQMRGTDWVDRLLEQNRTQAARIAELEKALEPFARVAKILSPLVVRADSPLREVAPGTWPTLRDCQYADQALRAAEKEEGT